MAFVHVLTNISSSLRYREVWLDNRIVYGGKMAKNRTAFCCPGRLGTFLGWKGKT